MNQCQNFYDRQIQDIQKDTVLMADLVSRCLGEAMGAMEDKDTERAQAVIDADDEIDDIDYAIEMKVLELIALQQPEREDLRLLASVLRIIKDLERIGDYAVNVAQVAVKLASLEYFKPLQDIPRMARAALEMLDMSMKAFQECDVDLARRVAVADDPVDRLFYHLQAELADWMKRGPEYVDQACQLALVARYLERVADHAVNIAEMAYFLRTGERRPFGGERRRVR